jgi:16S rRNA G966 N2-methylase RsmD
MGPARRFAKMIDPTQAGSLNRALFEYGTSFEPLSHYLFRYPAKFHPPIVRELIERYTQPGDTVYDPFLGSGTLAVEAMAAKRNSLGADVDPIAVIVARAKTRRFQMRSLRSNAERLLKSIDRRERSAREYEHRMFVDLSVSNFNRQIEGLRKLVPAIPQIEHWFRRYVIVDLAVIRKEILRLPAPQSHIELFDVVFASIIRNSSNADPVPVSGLEVTSHMIKKDEEGRLVNPFALFRKALHKALDSVECFTNATDSDNSSKVYLRDATRFVPKHPVDAVITSPPYHGAVDYYRRHKLEMYWLGQTRSEAERRQLLDLYIGRVSVPKRNRFLSADAVGPLSEVWEARIRDVKPSRANAFRHYQTSMRDTFVRLSSALSLGHPAALVVGHSTWNGTEFPTSDLFEELAGKLFTLQEVLSYPLKNRYMSYARRNGANIQAEHVMVFRRTSWSFEG